MVFTSYIPQFCHSASSAGVSESFVWATAHMQFRARTYARTCAATHAYVPCRRAYQFCVVPRRLLLLVWRAVRSPVSETKCSLNWIGTESTRALIARTALNFFPDNRWGKWRLNFFQLRYLIPSAFATTLSVDWPILRSVSLVPNTINLQN